MKHSDTNEQQQPCYLSSLLLTASILHTTLRGLQFIRQMFARGAKSFFDGPSFFAHVHNAYIIYMQISPHTYTRSILSIHLCINRNRTNSLFNNLFPSETPVCWAWMHNAYSLYMMKSQLQYPSLCTVKLHLILHRSCGITYAHNIPFYFSPCCGGEAPFSSYS